MGYFDRFLESPLADRVPMPRQQLAGALVNGFEACGHGDLGRWIAAIDALPQGAATDSALDRRAVTIGASGAAPNDLRTHLEALRPWRKGPFALHGIEVDTEWRSWMKWDRIAEAVDVTGCTVLDVGSGNGYYGWRMLGAGADAVIGVDPTPVYVAQALAVQRLAGPTWANWVLPLKAEQLTETADFDRVFSMGVLYHQRAPLQHLADLRRWTRPGGQAVVETLVVPGDERTVLTPRDRYARMRNVWHVPSPEALLRWLERAGFRSARVVDVSTTSTDEQRRTDWMPFHSLAEFLDPNDASLTVEGYPAPCRAIAVAER